MGFHTERAGILVQQRENLDTLVRGFYAPSQKRYYARATLDAVELSALDPLLKGVVERTGGNADVDIALRGSGKEANLSGQIAVRDFTTTVDFTQVTYTMPRTVIEVKNNQFDCRRRAAVRSGEERGPFLDRPQSGTFVQYLLFGESAAERVDGAQYHFEG